MRVLDILIPLLGIVISASVPIVRYALRDRHERVAIEVMRQINDAQRAFHARVGAYATNYASLTIPCGGAPALLSDDTLTALDSAGYAVQLRPARGVSVSGTDCHGHAVVGDYYVAAAPVSAGGTPRQAIAGTSDGRLYLFYDGIAPDERDITSGLATPVEARETFKIP